MAVDREEVCGSVRMWIDNCEPVYREAQDCLDRAIGLKRSNPVRWATERFYHRYKDSKTYDNIQVRKYAVTLYFQEEFEERQMQMQKEDK